MTIALQDVRFAYRDGAPVLDGVSAAIGPGRVTAVVGPNAAGKSTILRLMLGVLRPTAGRITLDGRDVASLPPRRRAARIAYVAQRPMVSAALRVREVVELGRYALPAAPSRITAALERLELAHLAERVYGELSVGQQQRVALARAMAQLEPGGVLLLDEPTSAMDLRHELSAADVIRRAAASNASVVVVMHDVALAAARADDAWLLAAGRLAAAGPAAEVLVPARLETVFGVPFTHARTGDGRTVLVAG